MNKILLTAIVIFISFNLYSQTDRDKLLEEDIEEIVEELKFMYHYDQATREYLYYQTFDKNITDSIESLDKDVRDARLKYTPVNSDSLKKKIWNTYINPMDQLHTERMIQITKKYGFPSAQRLKKFAKDSIDFNPLILLIHSPKKFSRQLIEIAEYEKTEGRIQKCDYGYLLWHLNGRSNFQPMLENGYEMIKDDNGGFHLTAVDCD